MKYFLLFVLSLPSYNSFANNRCTDEHGSDVCDPRLDIAWMYPECCPLQNYEHIDCTLTYNDHNGYEVSSKFPMFVPFNISENDMLSNAISDCRNKGYGNCRPTLNGGGRTNCKTVYEVYE